MSNDRKSIPDVPFCKPAAHHGLDMLELAKLAAMGKTLTPRIDQPHRIKFNLLMLVEEGQGAHEIDFESVPVVAPSLVLVPRGHVHRFLLPTELHGTNMMISQEALSRTLESVRLAHLRGLFQPSLTPSVLPLSANEFAEIKRLYGEIQSELKQTGETTGDVMTALVQLLLLRISECRGTHPPLKQLSGHMEQYLRFLGQLDAAEDLSRNASDHAQQLGISNKHLNMICREFTGQSAKEFIDERIIQEGKRDLVATDLTVAQIAFRLGFREATNFGKFFKKRAGETPLSFRRSVRDAHWS